MLLLLVAITTFLDGMPVDTIPLVVTIISWDLMLGITMQMEVSTTFLDIVQGLEIRHHTTTFLANTQEVVIPLVVITLI